MTIYASKKELSLLKLFEKFISDTKTGRRLNPNGKRVHRRTIENYSAVLLILKKFCIKLGFYLRIRPLSRLQANEVMHEKKYWKFFYRRFTNFMYEECHFYDNYAGHVIKIIRTFFGYLKKELAIDSGDFHKSFYPRAEDIPVITLQPAQVRFLISDKAFENSLSSPLKRCKDIVVIGCTVGLRFTDLIHLKGRDIENVNGEHYLVNTSHKTEIRTCVKLPGYAVEIISHYTRFKKAWENIFTPISLNQFNRNLRSLAEKAGWLQEMVKERSKNGKLFQVLKHSGKRPFRFCDLLTSHVMRRTAITNMLISGMPADVVRKISGHIANSKSFYRYINYAQPYLDEEIAKFHNRIQPI